MIRAKGIMAIREIPFQKVARTQRCQKLKLRIRLGAADGLNEVEVVEVVVAGEAGTKMGLLMLILEVLWSNRQTIVL